MTLDHSSGLLAASQGPSTLSCGPLPCVSIHVKMSAEPGQAQLGLGLGMGPSPCPSAHTQESVSSTQRWEHCTAVLTFSTRAVTFVWYSTSALEASLFLTGRSRGEGWPACREGVGALCGPSDAPPTSSGEATQELGSLQSRLYLNWLPPQPALERLHPEQDQKRLA